MLCYSAGAISHYARQGNDVFEEKAIKWRIELKDKLSELGIKVFDPTLNFDSNLSYNDKSIVFQNRYYLDKSDILIVNLAELDESPGTIWEIYRAVFKDKIILAFGWNDWYQSPHIKSSITERFDTLDEVVEYIKNLYSQNF